MLVMSEEFAAELDSYEDDLKAQVVRRLHQLVENPRHPSLNAHRLEAHPGKWEFYVNAGYRVIYDREGGETRLWKLGNHEIIDRVQYATFSPHTAFRRVELEEAPVQVQASKTYAPPASVEGTPNRFRYLPAAHLRVLGVPAHLVKTVQRSPSAEAALATPGLPEPAVRWLMDLLTDPSLERMVFDEGRLLYRTTLDRLEGYCQGSIRQLMLNLTPEQEQYVTAPRHGVTLLKGVAGSGKTTVGIYRAIRRAEQGRRVLMLTYNKTLNAATRSLIESLIGPLPANLEVVNIDRWVTDYLAGQGIPIDPLDEADCLPLIQQAVGEERQARDEAVLGHRIEWFRDEIGRVIKGGSILDLQAYLNVPRYGRQTPLVPDQRRAVWRVYERYQRRLSEAQRCDWRDPVLKALDLLTLQPLDNPYDDVIVDEGQDLTAAQLRLVQRLIKGREYDPTRTLLLLGDAAQSIYSRGFTWRQAGIRAQGATSTLRVNHRNTRQIAEAAARLLEQNYILRAGEDFVTAAATTRTGPSPLIITCDVADREVRAVREQILDLVADGRFRVSDFAVLAPRVELCREVRNDLDKASIHCALYSDEAFDLLEEQVKILTIHSAKGLEFPVVFVVGLREGWLPLRPTARLDPEEKQLELERQRTLLYVAMTRAAEALYLVTTQGVESLFLGEMNGSIRRMPFTAR